MLTFDNLRYANLSRANSGVFGHTLLDWNANDWALALVGEVGEALNVIKKMHRGDFDGDADMGKQALANELADVQTYLDLLAAYHEIDLGEATREKFNAVSAKRNSPYRI